MYWRKSYDFPGTRVPGNETLVQAESRIIREENLGSLLLYPRMMLSALHQAPGGLVAWTVNSVWRGYGLLFCSFDFPQTLSDLLV
ncbi:hypothetical protein TNCV_3375981 [Trichonephila clavipes]|nr:hypothetical protein TNCV_3375981 [Trichonephila clavipes]